MLWLAHKSEVAVCLPAASARTFFRAPQISTPVTSVVVLTRRYGLAKRLCSSLARFLSCALASSYIRAQV